MAGIGDSFIENDQEKQYPDVNQLVGQQSMPESDYEAPIGVMPEISGPSMGLAPIAPNVNDFQAYQPQFELSF